MGCHDDYRVQGVRSSITPIPGGFRLTSHDLHCGWWLRCSDFPVAWNEQQRAYVWTDTPYQAGKTYPCSLGTFTIHAMASPDCMTDFSLMLDKRWVDTHTIFIFWDTMIGCYKRLDGTHLR
jgi:hypothetical protein